MRRTACGRKECAANHHRRTDGRDAELSCRGDPVARARAKKRCRRPQARLPAGFRDYVGSEIRRRRQILQVVAEVFEGFGFDPLETPAIEYLDALGKFLPDVDRPNAGVFAWKEDETWLSLRYDMTAPLARYFAQHRAVLPSPFRRYTFGSVWRNEKPGPGRFRQFTQCDADTVGSGSPAADAEMIALATRILEEIGIRRGGYMVKLNNRKLLDGLLLKIGMPRFAEDPSDEAQRSTVLRAIDKLERLGSQGVRALLGPGRRDESGDFTAGAGLAIDQIDTIMAFLDVTGGGDDVLRDLEVLVAGSDAGAEGLAETEAVMELVRVQGVGPDRCVIDTTVVRGLGYYTGPVFEAELINSEDCEVPRVGSVAGGGRYDGLVQRFTGQRVPATGISLGVDRLLAAELEGQAATESTRGPVVVTIMDRHRLGDYQAMVTELRNADICAELFLGNARNFGRQLKYADARRCSLAVIQGENELRNGTVMIKDLQLGARISATATAAEWKRRAWQQEIPRDRLVAVTRKLLAGQSG